jgi:N-methylhydantoinase A
MIKGAGFIVQVPTIDIAEVGAGGGSIAAMDRAGGLLVGPRSSGAEPGRHATTAAARSPRSPTRTSCSAT